VQRVLFELQSRRRSLYGAPMVSDPRTTQLESRRRFFWEPAKLSCHRLRLFAVFWWLFLGAHAAQGIHTALRLSFEKGWVLGYWHSPDAGTAGGSTFPEGRFSTRLSCHPLGCRTPFRDHTPYEYIKPRRRRKPDLQPPSLQSMVQTRQKSAPNAA
jgi:hypothetical protein